jgi:hypothetical protein
MFPLVKTSQLARLNEAETRRQQHRDAAGEPPRTVSTDSPVEQLHQHLQHHPEQREPLYGNLVRTDPSLIYRLEQLRAEDERGGGASDSPSGGSDGSAADARSDRGPFGSLPRAQALTTLDQLLAGGRQRGNQPVVLSSASASDSASATPDEAELREALTQAGVDLAKLNADDAQKVIDAARDVRDKDLSGQLKGLSVIAATVPAQDLVKVIEALGVKNTEVLELATDSKALAAVATLADADASNTDKVAAALTLAESLGQVAPEKVQEVLKPYLAALPAGAKLAEAVGTWFDPDASALDKAQAALDVVQASKEALGDAFPQLAQKLRAGDSLTRSVQAGITLLDPDASIADKAKATAELLANVPDLRTDIGALRQMFERNDITHAQDAIDLGVRNDALQALPDELQRSLDPEVVASLSDEQLAQLQTLAADKSLLPSLTSTFDNLHSGQAASALLDALSQSPADSAAKKAMLDTLAGMKDGVADKLLTSQIGDKPAAEVLTQLASTLDAKGQQNLAKLLRDFDADAAQLFLRIADRDSTGALKQLLKLADHIDSKLASKFLGAFDKLISKAGIEFTADVAGKLAKGLGKVIPFVGAAPAAYDAARLARIAADTGLPPDLRFLALQGSKLNGADALFSVLEPFGIAATLGLGTPAIVGIDAGLALGELAVDLLVSDQIAKHDANPQGYEPPAWLSVVNVTLAAAQGPAGALDLVAIYGANGAVDVIGKATRAGGSAAIHAAEVAVTLPADALESAAGTTADGLHLLADIIRHPDKYGAAAERLGRQAVERLSELAQGATALARNAAQELSDLAGELKELGKDGVKALAWIASHPGESAVIAAHALRDLAEQGLALGTAAGRALAQASLEGLAQARDALEAAGRAVGEAYDAVTDAVDATVDAAVRAGQAGIDTLAWIANHPGKAADIAGEALVNIASRAGAYASAAYDAIVGLGARGVELGQQVISNLKDLGEDGVQLLEYVAAHPGEAASALRKAAGQALSDLAKTTGRVAQQATDALLRLVDNGVEEVKDTVTHLLSESAAAVERAAQHWGDSISDAGKEVLDGLADLGDAGRDALAALAGKGVDWARSLLSSVWGGIRSGVDFLTPW